MIAQGFEASQGVEASRIEQEKELFLLYAGAIGIIGSSPYASRRTDLISVVFQNTKQ
ncbi:MAG: hypothetical protein QXO76_07975 [Thermoproteota archaeon]